MEHVLQTNIIVLCIKFSLIIIQEFKLFMQTAAKFVSLFLEKCTIQYWTHKPQLQKTKNQRKNQDYINTSKATFKTDTVTIQKFPEFWDCQNMLHKPWSVYLILMCICFGFWTFVTEYDLAT